MKYKGIVFDFNGTLFWDTKLHNEAWDIFLEKYQIRLNDDEKFRTFHGKTNKDIFITLFGNILSDQQIIDYIIEKETLYQKLCLEYLVSTDNPLAPGVVPFLDLLEEREIPFTIATASDKINVDFYFEHLGLSQWFDYSKVVYNDGTIRGKPNPDLYQKALSIIGLLPAEVIVFEDAINGLMAARNAEAGKIIIVDSNNDDYSGWENFRIITDYNQLDYSELLYL